MKEMTKKRAWIRGIAAVLLAWGLPAGAGTPATVASRQGAWQLVQTDDGSGKALSLERIGGGSTQLSRVEIPAATATNVYRDAWAGGAVVTNVSALGADFQFQAFVNGGRAYWEDWADGESRLWSAPCDAPEKKTLLASAPNAAGPWSGVFHAEPHLRGARWAQPSAATGGAVVVEMVSESGTDARERGEAKALRTRGVRPGHAARYSGCGGSYPQPKQQEVVFCDNDGKSPEGTTTEYYTVGETYGSLPNRKGGDGASFEGWYTARQGGVQIFPTSPVQYKGKRFLYAHWHQLSQKVTFDPRGGNCDTQTRFYYIGVGERYGWLPEPNKSGHDFKGWYDKRTGAHVTKNSYVTTDKERTLNAHWNKQPQTQWVTFDPNGGSVSPVSGAYTIGGTYGSLPKATWDGLKFAGWWTAKSGGTQVKEGDRVPSGTSRTLYAHWQLLVRFYGNGAVTAAGQSTVDQWVTLEESQKLKANSFTKAENTLVPLNPSGCFLGWHPWTSLFEWTATADDKKSLLMSDKTSLSFTKKNVDYYSSVWENVDGELVSVVKLYAIWKTVTTVELFNTVTYVNGVRTPKLEPASLKDHVKFSLSQDNTWRRGGESVDLKPGHHQLILRIDSGYQHYVTDWDVVEWTLGTPKAGNGDGDYQFDLSSGWDGSLQLYVKLEAEQAGSVRFSFANPADVPGELDVGQIVIYVGGNLIVTGDEAFTGVSLPAGTYMLGVNYGNHSYSPWGEFRYPSTFTVKAGKETECKITFVPNGG